MNLLLKRIFLSNNYTIGHLYIDGIYFCDTLEDAAREYKIMHQTCIPLGTYKVILNFSNRFQRIMPRILDVPGFDGILMHNGRTAADTSGCVLVGKNTVKGELRESRITFNSLFLILRGAVDDIYIEITLEVKSEY